MAAIDPRPRLRVAFRTLGCRLNQYDTEVMRTALSATYPLVVVDWHDEADLYVLNSCTVTGKADQECRRLARQVKRRHPAGKVVVAGCYAQTQPAQLAVIPEIDAVIGNTLKEDTAAWLPDLLAATAGPLVRVEPFATDAELRTPLIDRFAERSRAFIKVQDGCNLRCSYCLIWQARGPARSRRVDEVLAQVGQLEAAGYRELVLTGINLGSYGQDLGDGDGLVRLLRTCADTFSTLRFRLGSIHPDEVTDQLFELIALRPQLRPHLHISLQSGSDSVLARMRRPYRGAAARGAVTRAAASLPNCAIGADLIVGFPGESAAEFAATQQMVEDLPFSYLHVFRFSPRPGTAAATLADPVHPESATARSALLRRLAQTKQDRFRQAQIGRWCEAVVESESAVSDIDPAAPELLGDWRCATTDNYVPVLVPAGWPAGTLVRVLPTEQYGDRLIARRIETLDDPKSNTSEVATKRRPNAASRLPRQDHGI